MGSKKRIRALLLCALMLCSVLLMCACGGEQSETTAPSAGETTGPAGDQSGEAKYKVTVVDGSGAPYAEKIIVKFMKGDQQVAMIPVSEQGVAEKALEKGDYTVQIMSTDAEAEFFFDSEAAKLTADKTEIQLVLAMEQGESFETINANSSATGSMLPYDAYYVQMGTTHVTVTGEDRNYFLFTPTEPGTYEIYVDQKDATVGIYGGSVHFVMENSTHEMVDGKITLQVQASMIGTGDTGTNVYVLGVDVAEGTTECLLNVVCTGEAGWSFEEEPWSSYQPEEEIVSYKLPDGITLKKFDLTAPDGTYELVYNEEDGCYHVNAADGPMVFVQLAEPMNGISMMAMVGEIVYQDGVLMQTGSAPFRYSYNNGEDDFFKEDYTDAMRQYVTNRDKDTGVYPLNKDLFYILPQGIEQMGWCREDTANYLFTAMEDANPDLLWMFMLMHEDAQIPEIDVEDPTDPTDPSDPSDPTEPSEDTIPSAPSDPVDHTDPTEPEIPTECPHTYSVAHTTPATCTTDGVDTYTCDLCGDSYTEQVAAAGHSFTVASCNSPMTCSVCGATSGDALGHKFEDATCTAPKTCSVCGATSGDALGHDLTEATCTEPAVCKVCDEVIKGAAGHSYDENGLCKVCGVKDPDHVDVGEVCAHNYKQTKKVEPTCTKKGSAVYTCTKCDDSYTESIPKTAHNYYRATCTEPKTCRDCGAVDGKALGHSYGDDTLCINCGMKDPATMEDGDCKHQYKITNSTPATCSKEGSVTYTCSACKDSYTAKIAAKGHSYMNATCTAPKTCDVCGATSGKALGHDYNAATCTTPKTCKVCAATEGKPLGHDFKAATCTAPKKCKTCGVTSGSAAGHVYKDATCTEPKSCKNCDVTIGNALGHSYKAATCTAPKTCKLCGKTKGEALGHDYKAATCTAPKTCKTCGKTKGDALGHDYKAATCTAPKTCKICGATSGKAAGHSFTSGSCTEPKSCKICGLTEGVAPGHSYNASFTCISCGKDAPFKPVIDNPGEPVLVGGTLEFEADVAAGHMVYFDLLKVNDLTLKIQSPNAYVIYNDEIYEAVDGVVTVPDLFVQFTNMPVQIGIGNKGSNDAVFSVKLTYPAGHRENPYKMKIGAFTADLKAGNDQGLYYSWTATKTGKLTIRVDSVTKGLGAAVTITKVVDEIPVQVELAEGQTSLAIDVTAGDEVTVIVCVRPTEDFRYLAATISLTSIIE